MYAVCEQLRTMNRNISEKDRQCTRWFKYDRDYLCVNKSQFVPVIFEPPCTMYVKRNFEARSCNHCCNRKAVRKTYCVCVCVCVSGGGGGVWERIGVRVCLRACCLTQHAKRMRRIILSCGHLQQMFRHYLINNTIFEENGIGHKMCSLTL